MLMEPGAFRAILLACDPGQEFKYYTGDLLYDGFRNMAVKTLGKVVWQAYCAGKGVPVQRRVQKMSGPEFPPIFDYIFQKTATR